VTDADRVRAMLRRLVDGRIALQRRLEAGLTQDEVAQRAGVSRRTVGRLEDGEHVRPESTVQIATALGLDGENDP
jgi:DNA-binding XRE family transcriptional regulator